MPNTEPMNSPAKKKMLYKSYINSISARNYEPDKTDAGGQLDALLSTYGIMGEGIRASRIFSQDKENGFVALTDVSNEAILNRLRSGEVLLISDSSGFPRSLSAMQLDGTEYLQCMSPEEALSFHASRDQYFADKAEIIPPEEPDILTIICNFFVELLFGHYSKGMQEWIQYRDLFMKQEGIDTFMHSEAVTARQTEAEQRLQEQVRMIQQQQQEQQQEQQPLPQEVNAPAEQNEIVEANENIQQKEEVPQQKDEQQAEGEEEKKEEEQPSAENEEIEPVEKKEEASVVEDKKEEAPVAEDKKEDPAVEEKKEDPVVEDKKDEPAPEKKEEKPAAYNPVEAYSKNPTVLREQLKMAQDFQNRLAAAEQMIREKQERERQKEELLRKKQEEERKLEEQKEKQKWADAIKKSEEIDPNLKGELERIEQRKKEFSEQVRAEKKRKERAKKLAQAVRISERREAMNPLKTSEDYRREQRRLDKLVKEEIEAVKEHLAFERRLAELQQKRLELADPQRVEARKNRMEQLNRMMVERDMPLAYLAKICFENRENEFEANVPKRFDDLKADQNRRDEDYKARLRELDKQWRAATTEKEKKAILKIDDAVEKEYRSSDEVYEKEQKKLEKTIEKERATLKSQFEKYQKVFDKKGMENEAALLKALPEDVRKRIEEKREIDLTGAAEEYQKLANEETEYYELGKLEDRMQKEHEEKVKKDLADSIKFAKQKEERYKEIYGDKFREVMMKEVVQNKKDLEDAAKRGKAIAERLKREEEKAERQLKFLLQRQQEILRANAEEYWDNHAMDEQNEMNEQNEMSEQNEKKEKEVNKGKEGPVRGM